MVAGIMPEDISEVTENALITTQLDESVQEFPDANTGAGMQRMSFGMRTLFERKSLLGLRGTYRRLILQYSWYYHEDNTMFRSIISGLSKRVQSLPYEIKAPEEDGRRWDDMLRYANFSTWEEFVGQLINNYSISDTGAFIEIIAPGDPRSEPTGPATGIAILDSRNCWPTGDPMFPAIYTNNKGVQHLLHRSRVVQFMEMGDSNDNLPGFGDSAMGRCITPAFREILMAQFMRASLDDMPAPGFALAKNLTEDQVNAQIDAMKTKRENDQDMLGRIVFLFGADTSEMAALEFIQFAKEFTGFDPDKLSAMNAKYMAAGVGVDIQDFWELSGRAMGTATQSEVLDQKSKGRALGRLIKGIERTINDVLPDDVEFSIKYRNEEEDLERAQTAQAWATAIQMLEALTTIDERRIIATNQIPALKDAVTDDAGNIIRYDDADPKTPEQAAAQHPLEAETDITEEETPDENLIVGEEKDYRRTAASFKRAFNEVVKFMKSGLFTAGSANVVILNELRKKGETAYIDGLKRAGAKKPVFDDRGQRELSQWLSRQRPLVTGFVTDVESGKFSDKELTNRGLQWANGSLIDMMYKGMEANKRKKWRWVTNFFKENCVTCLALHGQVHQFKTYSSRNLLPKSIRLVCHGFNCGCKLVEDDGPVKGRIAAVRFVRRALNLQKIKAIEVHLN